MAADTATYAIVKTGGKQYKVAVGDIGPFFLRDTSSFSFFVVVARLFVSENDVGEFPLVRQ